MRIVHFYLLVLWAAVLLSESMVAAEELNEHEEGCYHAQRYLNYLRKKSDGLLQDYNRARGYRRSRAYTKYHAAKNKEERLEKRMKKYGCKIAKKKETRRCYRLRRSMKYFARKVKKYLAKYNSNKKKFAKYLSYSRYYAKKEKHIKYLRSKYKFNC